MKKLNYLVITLALITVSVFAVAMDTKEEVADGNYEYLERSLTNAKDFTLEVIEGMPVDSFTFKPAEEMRTFGEQAFHIAYSLEWYNARLQGKAIAWEPGDESRMNKEELTAYTTEQFDTFIKIISETEEKGQFTAGILEALRHNSHHRGQMVAYYRANGLTPPAYK